MKVDIEKLKNKGFGLGFNGSSMKTFISSIDGDQVYLTEYDTSIGDKERTKCSKKEYSDLVKIYLKHEISSIIFSTIGHNIVNISDYYGIDVDIKNNHDMTNFLKELFKG